MSNLSFRSELKALCKEKGITFIELAKKIKCTYTVFSKMGSTQGIGWEKLNKVLDILEPDYSRRYNLILKAKYTHPRQPLIIDDAFIDAIWNELLLRNTNWDDQFEVCKAVLKFVGVKSKTIKNLARNNHAKQ